MPLFFGMLAVLPSMENLSIPTGVGDVSLLAKPRYFPCPFWHSFACSSS